MVLMQTAMRLVQFLRKKVRRWVLGAVALACVLILVLFGLSKRRQETRDAKDELLIFRASVVQAQAADDIELAFQSSKYSYLQLWKEKSTEWVITTPLRFGASNWYLYIEFDHSKATALRLRLADSRDLHPDDAPPDINWKVK